ncbi:MAG TPA: hypothetical protein VM511_01085, partial [Luteolibacter sp.]|nr:hypothetical protein [Luteolibacter sp.]
ALTFFNENDVLIRSADFDGDGDADFLISDKYFSLTLVLNPSVEERSAITRRLIGLGVSPHLASPGKDADGDGRSNVEEFLHGDDPLLSGEPDPDPFGLNLGIDGSDAYVSYRLPRNAETLDLDYTIQRSTDLREWKTDLTASAEMLFLGGDRVFLRQDVEREGDRAFFRLHGIHRLDE